MAGDCGRGRVGDQRLLLPACRRGHVLQPGARYGVPAIQHRSSQYRYWRDGGGQYSARTLLTARCRSSRQMERSADRRQSGRPEPLAIPIDAHIKEDRSAESLPAEPSSGALPLPRRMSGMIRGELTNLRAAERSDAEFLLGLLNSESVQTGWGTPGVPVSGARIQADIENWLASERLDRFPT